MIELAIGVLFILIMAAFIIWAIWGKVPWKTVGKVLLTLLVIVIAFFLVTSLLNKAFA
ncbi:hypothetical protein SAMN02745171_00497 [Porphyromonas circumdentaria]|uniref:Uncharacterized protein n=1 Tax=Porphyromonas circumdentaria TaxID=29524 RepID=A0A1T4LS34_9PORP|nr:membrane protein YdbS with pleckstrin-like domain [Porphyromonas circumdentaria]SJZ57264.1 hypothetical protein SAMN02745171_00497 [Porphyromonas circumdentaria]